MKLRTIVLNYIHKNMDTKEELTYLLDSVTQGSRTKTMSKSIYKHNSEITKNQEMLKLTQYLQDAC